MRKKINPQEEGLKAVYCIKCGKEFYPTSEHIYKDNRGRYCSWTCFNHRNDGKKSRYTPVEKCTLNGVLIETYQSLNKANEYNAGCSISGIREAIETREPYKGFLWRYKNES